MVAACYRYVVLGILVAVLVVIATCAIEALAPEPKWVRLLYLTCIAGAAGAVVAHVYDNNGTLKLPEIGPSDLQLAVFGDILIGIFAAFATVYLLHAGLKADPDQSAGLALLAGLAGARLIPGFRDTIAKRLSHVEELQKKLEARDYFQLGQLRTEQKKYSEAIQFYLLALDRDKKYFAAISALADTYLHMATDARATDAAKAAEFEQAALARNYEAEAAAGDKPASRGSILAQRANILKAMGRDEESAAALQASIDCFRGAQLPLDQIHLYVMANEYLAKAYEKGDARIKPIIDAVSQVKPADQKT
jgi:tetratricopeptide (TPR) repeat protein